MSGADLQDVADLLGHRDLRMTRRYAHLSPAHLSAAAKRLDGVFGSALPGWKAGHDEVTMEQQNSTKMLQTTASMEVAPKPHIYSVVPSVSELRQTTVNVPDVDSRSANSVRWLFQTPGTR